MAIAGIVVAGTTLFSWLAWSRHGYRMRTKYLLLAVFVLSIPMTLLGERLRTYVDDYYFLRLLQTSNIQGVGIGDDYSIRLEALEEHRADRPLSGRVFKLDVSNDQGIAEIPEILQRTPNCKSIDLALNVTNDGLARLSAMPEAKQVTTLSIFESKITDEGLVALGDMEQLEVLWLNERNITDTGLFHVGKLKGLKRLGLLEEGGMGNSARITGMGLRHLEGLTKLEDVLILGLRLSDEAPRHLAKLESLERLVLLRGTTITNAGVETLAGLSHLKSLALDSSKLDDSCIVHLENLSSLELLSVRGTSITPAGVSRLSTELPNCDVSSDD